MLTVVALLALGIGASTAVFSIVDAVLLRPVPYPGAAALLRIEETSTKQHMVGIPVQDYLVWSGRHDLFRKTVPYFKDILTVTGNGDPDQVAALRTTSELFSLIGARAALGRTLVGADDAAGAAGVVVLSDHYWQRKFHADAAVIGRPLTLADEPFTIAGVMPPGFDLPSSEIDMWVPLHINPATPSRLQVAALPRDGLSAPDLQNALKITAAQMERQNPRANAGLEIRVSPWRETVSRQYELTLIFTLVAVGLVLLIACADVASLLLSRAVERHKETAVRASLGAGFWRVARQVLAEGFVITVLGSLAGIATARFVLQFLIGQLSALPIVVPHLQRIGLNGRVLAFNVMLCVLLACLCSLAPLLHVARTDLHSVLRGGHAAGQRRSSRVFAVLIASEAAFAFLLLVGSGLMIRSLVRLQQADHGFHPDHVLTLRVPIGTLTQPRPKGKYETIPRQVAYYHELLDRLQRIPGVRYVALVNNLPLSGSNTTLATTGTHGEPTFTVGRTISPDYFTAMGIPLIAGRAFSESDGPDSPRVTIVNEYLARQLYPDRNPAAVPPSGNIVGVVKDSAQGSYEDPVKAEMYLPYTQKMFGTFLSTIVVRTSGDPLELAAAIRKQVWAVDPSQPVVKIETMEDVVATSIWRPRFSTWLLSVLSGLALLLVCGGIYGVISYTTALQAREVGIRVALGAGPRCIVSTVVRRAMIPLAAGLLASVAAALLLSRLLQSILYHVSSTDPLTYGGAVVLLLLVGVGASARPALKAALADPVRCLRME